MFLHVSECYNHESILKNGICPKSITLWHHEQTFREDGLLEENENKMAYYFVDSDQNERFIKDTIYGKVFITPRNKLVNGEMNQAFDYSKYEGKNLYKHDCMIFNIYLLKSINEAKKNYRPFHWQKPGEHIYNSLYRMDERYSHDDKILAFSKTPETNIKLIGQAFFEFTKRKKVEIKLMRGFSPT